MYLFEGALLLATIGLLVAVNHSRVPRSICRLFVVLGLVAIMLAFAFGQARMHLAPAVLVFIVASLFALRRKHSHIAIRATGVVLGLGFVAISSLLALAFPIVSLPAPDGPNPVGVTSFNISDEQRTDASFGAPERQRELYVQAWYPGTLDASEPAPIVRTLWQELYRDDIHWLFKVLFGYLGGIDTHSYQDIPVADANVSYPTILFSPSLSGIAEQNTLLMEHLASHGYIVLGLSHPNFAMYSAYADGTGSSVSPLVMDAMTEQAGVDLDALTQLAERSSDPLEAAEIVLDYFDQGVQLTELLDIWVADLDFLMDELSGPATRVPSFLAERVDPTRIGLLGMSYGGGAITAFCKADQRCRAAVNLDGGLWGSQLREPVPAPYLVLASPGNRAFFEYGRLVNNAPYFVLTVDEVEHANFTDVSMFVPAFRAIGITGPRDGREVTEIVNQVSGRFFDAYLGRNGLAEFNPPEFAGVSVATNNRH